MGAFRVAGGLEGGDEDRVSLTPGPRDLEVALGPGAESRDDSLTVAGSAGISPGEGKPDRERVAADAALNRDGARAVKAAVRLIFTPLR